MIKIKFSPKELKLRAAKVLGVNIQDILNVSPTMGGKSYLVLLNIYSYRGWIKKTKTISIWQMVEAIPIEESDVRGFYPFLDLSGAVEDLLEILELSEIPKSIAHLKAHFRKLAKRHHPDVGGSGEHFIKLNKAYEQLSGMI